MVAASEPVDTARAERQSHRSVFIVGCARTGSTLLRHVLNRSAGVVILPETHFMRRSAALGLPRRLAAARTRQGLTAVVDRLYAVDAQSRTGYWAWLRRTVPRSEFAMRLDTTDHSLRGLFALLVDLYVEHSDAQRPLSVIGEKTPSHLMFIPTLVDWFPSTVVIHTFRDPRAVYASELRRRREGRWGPKQRLRWVPGALMDAILGPFEAIRTAIVWRRADELDVVYRQALGERYLLVRFEDLVARPLEELSVVCQHLGIPFDAALLDIDVVGSSFEPGRHATTGFNPVTVDRWRHHVGPVARAWFRLVLGRRMHARGYGP
ncbi:MAG: sulfotransferase family protein [Candidatus Limnocylindria bacterium]